MSSRCVALANRLVGILHRCLHYGVLYHEETAWGTGHNKLLDKHSPGV